MAKKVLKLDSILQLQRLATDPATGVEAGQLYYNTTANKVRQYDGTSWAAVSGGLTSQPLNQYSTIVGNVSNVSASVDTNAQGDVQASVTGLNIKSAVITDAKIAAGASISYTKLAPLTASRALQSSPSGYTEVSPVTTTELSYVSGVTSGLQTQLNGKLNLTGGTLSGALDLGGNKITSLGTPTQTTDAATKGYVDAVKQGLDIKDSVRVGTTANITLSGTQTIDAVVLVAGDRVLVKDQTAGQDNGIYAVAAGAWTRTTDADTSTKVTSGLFTFITEGTLNGDSGWVLTTNDPLTLGTTPLAFTQFSGTGSIVAGNGLSKTGNSLDVNVDNSTIEIVADTLQVKDLGITNAKLASGIAATKIGTGLVDNTEFGYLDGVTSAIQTQLNAKLTTVQQDTTPTLGGDLNTNGKALDTLRIGTSSQFSQDVYMHSATLTAGATASVITALTIDKTVHDTVFIDYKVKEATTNNARVGRFMVTTDGTNVSMTDVFTDTNPINISFDAQITGNNVQVIFTSTSGQNMTMRAKSTRYLL